MSITIQRKEILTALRAIAGLQAVTLSWPRAQAPIPCVTVDLASRRATDRRDNTPYLTETEFYVRLFASREADFESLGPQVEQALEALGYEQVFVWEEPGQGVRQLAFRYRITN